MNTRNKGTEKTMFSNCKYQVGQKVEIGLFETDGLVIRKATVLGVQPKFHGNSSSIRLSVEHEDCYEDFRCDTRILTKLIKNAAQQPEAA
jgi:hypothetical protein